MVIDCLPLKGPNTTFWPVVNNNNDIVGKVTSAVYSPRLKKNIALAIVDITNSKIGKKLKIKLEEKIYDAIIEHKPFYDANKKIPAKNLNLNL